MYREIPTWLLDVDGVINVDKPRWLGKTAVGTATADGQRYTLRWAPQLIDEIKKIHTEKLANVVWCTTWCAWADELERLWDIDWPLDRAFLERRGRYTDTIKLSAALDVVRADIPLIWTDDSAVPTHGPTYVDLTRSGRTLLIKPNYDVGLTPRDIVLIREFCERMRDL